MTSDRPLHMAFATNQREISTDPLSSDSLLNLAHMEQVVGTLAQEGRSGFQEPFLAQSWEVSSDAREWRFHMRDGIATETGQPITAENFVESLKRSLRIYHNTRQFVPLFNKLEGFAHFLNGGDIQGLYSDGDVVVFRFSQPVRSGLLEYLSMPYFGYFAAENYDGLVWRNSSRLISSGAYRLASFDREKGRVDLEARKGWFSIDEQSPSRVVIEQIAPAGLAQFMRDNRGFALVMGDDEIPEVSGARELNGVQEVLAAMVLSPHLGPFRAVENRQAYVGRVRRAMLDMGSIGSQVISTQFYPESKASLDSPSSENSRSTGGWSRRPRVLLKESLSGDLETEIKDLVAQGFGLPQSDIDFVKLDRTQEGWFEEYTSNDRYDVRVVAVSIGGTVQPWLVEMMFCSKLGISFPDPKGEVCGLVEAFGRGEVSLEDFSGKFEEAIHSSAVVVPLYHTGLRWLIDESLDLSLAPTMAVPRFDSIRRR